MVVASVCRADRSDESKEQTAKRKIPSHYSLLPAAPGVVLHVLALPPAAAVLRSRLLLAVKSLSTEKASVKVKSI